MLSLIIIVLLFFLWFRIFGTRILVDKGIRRPTLPQRWVEDNRLFKAVEEATLTLKGSPNTVNFNQDIQEWLIRQECPGCHYRGGYIKGYDIQEFGTQFEITIKCYNGHTYTVLRPYKEIKPL